ncbi:MAG: hypothetical protein IJ172_02885, partial [Ruminococcus sp.]|nr:hypothetical protein [Ruminococcus sp.]
SILLNLCNTSPFFAGESITTVHDIMYKVNPSHYTTLRNKISRYWHMIQYSYLFRHEKLTAHTGWLPQMDIGYMVKDVLEYERQAVKQQKV